MDHPAVLTVFGITILAAGYCIAETVHHRRRRARPPSADDRLLWVNSERDLATYRARIEEAKAIEGVLASATAVVDDALARHTHDPKEGGPTP
ncbi:hypothetical protein [Streptomyces sp. NBC_01353]|uniref:hypothetical protein n=1 Tax=Streptomyces sp. NBC_01353 TaxID=2903835 RepID=UPI002E2EADFA|nr:hypothetical protein [Streptomyces sp. NBC_01353]